MNTVLPLTYYLDQPIHNGGPHLLGHIATRQPASGQPTETVSMRTHVATHPGYSTDDDGTDQLPICNRSEDNCLTK